MTLGDNLTETKKERICLFGGTFDPIHLGHIHIATAAQKRMQLDRIIFLPCKQSPHKANQTQASEEQRLTMCKLATSELNWAEVDSYDLTAPSPSYSWRTVEEMQKRHPEAKLFWLMGTDQWNVLPKWNRSNYLASMVDFIVFHRGNKPTQRSDVTMYDISGHHPASATEIRNSAITKLKEEWLDKKVTAYIKNAHIYRA